MQETENQKVVFVDPVTDEEEQYTGGKSHLWKKGQSGNIKGRPKGQTLKEYVRDMLSKLDDEEKREFLMGMPKETIWRMAEGNPVEDRTIKVIAPTPILGGVSQLSIEEQKALRESTMGAIEGSIIEDTGTVEPT